MKLDPIEKAILDSVEKGEWRSVHGLKAERKRQSCYAAATFRKDPGVPDAHIGLIHKFVSGRLQGF
jgi:hypothetical protein